MTHYCNDYFDLAADRANTSPTYWSGGSRVLPGGLLPARAALAGALTFAAIALFAVLVLGLFIQPSPWTFLLPLLALVLAWGYSAPPLKLHSRGAGEITVALIVPVLTPLVGYTFQAGSPDWLVLLCRVPAGLPPGLHGYLGKPARCNRRPGRKQTHPGDPPGPGQGCQPVPGLHGPGLRRPAFSGPPWIACRSQQQPYTSRYR